MKSPATFPGDPMNLRQKEPATSPALGFDYAYHPFRNYGKLIYHEYFQDRLPHRSQQHRYHTKVPHLGIRRIGSRARAYALNIIDRHLPPDLALLAYDYVLNCPNTLDLDLQRTQISEAAWRLLRLEEQRVLLECFLITDITMMRIADSKVLNIPSVYLSYEDIRIWHYFFFNVNLDLQPRPAYPKQMLHLYLRRLKTWFSRPQALSEKADPRSGYPFSLADIYAQTDPAPLHSYIYQMELLAGTRAITDTLSTYYDIFLKPLNRS